MLQTTVVDENSVVHNIPILVQPPESLKTLPRKTPSRSSSRALTPIESPNGLVTKEDVEEGTVDIIKEDGNVDCPFKIHGCHKRGAEMEVKRHVRDDRNLHLLLLCQSLNPIRNNAIRQQSTYVERYVELYQSMELAEAVFEKFGSQHIFHIPNVGLTVVRASKNKAHRTIFSQPFFSHGYGYRMMAICAPYGDGIALREYFSVFVCLMKSDYDAILEWPFKCKITFTISSEDKKQKISRCYDPLEHLEMSEFHQRPTGLRNGAVGFQNFVLLSDLQNFTISSGLFLEIRVDLRPEEIRTAQEIDSEKCQGPDF